MNSVEQTIEQEQKQSQRKGTKPTYKQRVTETHIFTEIDLTKAQNQKLYYVTEKISPPADQIQRPTIGQSTERKKLWSTQS